MVFGWFRRKKRQGVPSPKVAAAAEGGGGHWAHFLTLAQQRRVEALALEWFEKRGETARLGIGFVEVGGSQYGLDNVAQRCRPLPADEWPMVVDEHFGCLAAAEADQREWDARQDDFAWASTLLRLRLHHDEYLAEGRGEMMLHRLDVPRTCTCVVVDLPTAVSNVKPELLTNWRRSPAEVFDLALQQTLQQCPVEWEQVPIGGEAAGTVLHVASADHFFVCTHVLAPHLWPQFDQEHGVLVGIPDRHTMLLLPLAASGGSALVAAVSQFAALVAARHHRSPGGLSPHMYWRRPDGAADQRLELQEVASQGDGFVLVPSPELVERLGRIASG